MTLCPTCDHELTGSCPSCLSCGEFLGSPDDLQAFGWSLLALAVLACIGIGAFVIGPHLEIDRAISLVKVEDQEGVKKIRTVHDRKMIKVLDRGLAWGGEAFPGLDLVTFAYEQAQPEKATRDVRRLAVWWAVDPGKQTATSVGSVGEFVDRHLLRIAFPLIGLEPSTTDDDRKAAR